MVFINNVDFYELPHTLYQMNLRHLGDVQDHWKGSLLRELSSHQLVRDLAVNPMISDQAAWNIHAQELYQKLLGVKRSQIISYEQLPEALKEGCLDKIKHSNDIFLDPNVGIRTSRRGKKSFYADPEAIIKYLRSNLKSVVLVYQHAGRSSLTSRVRNIFDYMKELESNLSCCSYEAGSVAMLYFSFNLSRIEAIHSHYLTIFKSTTVLPRTQIFSANKL